MNVANQMKIPNILIFIWGHNGKWDTNFKVPMIASWISERRGTILFVGGNRESNYPGIGEFAEGFLMEIFNKMRGVQ